MQFLSRDFSTRNPPASLHLEPKFSQYPTGSVALWPCWLLSSHPLCLAIQLHLTLGDPVACRPPHPQAPLFPYMHTWCHVCMWELDCEESWALKNWCFWTVVLEKTLESPLDCKKIQLVHPKGDQSWVFIGRTDVETKTLAISCKELTHWKRPCCWEGLGAGGEGDTRGWDGWMASPTRWAWVWVNSGSWWWTGRPGVLRFMGSQKVRHDWATELNWEHRRCLLNTCWMNDLSRIIWEMHKAQMT